MEAHQAGCYYERAMHVQFLHVPRNLTNFHDRLWPGFGDDLNTLILLGFQLSGYYETNRISKYPSFFIVVGQPRVLSFPEPLSCKLLHCTPAAMVTSRISAIRYFNACLSLFSWLTYSWNICGWRKYPSISINLELFCEISPKFVHV